MKFLGNNMKIYTFHPNIYPVRIWIVVNGDKRKLAEEFEYIKDGEDYLHEEVNPNTKMKTYAYCSELLYNRKTTNSGVMIYLGAELKPSEMAHEACHAADMIYNYIGEDTIDFGSEANAYLVGWIVEKIDEVCRVEFKEK
jgi:hypothetical protein